MIASTSPRRFVAACASVLALSGCASWLLGADDDAPPPVTPFGSDATLPFGVDGAVPGDSGFVITKPNDGGLCPAASTKCGELCVSPSDPAYGCGAASCTACKAPTSHGQAICMAASCDISCETGYDKQGADCIKKVVVLPGEIGLVVDDARQTDTEALELSVTIRNGAGGASVPLDPTRFSVRMSDGREKAGSAGTASLRWWVGGNTPDAGDTLAADASYKWRVYVAGVTRGGPTPVSVTFTTQETTPRKATAPVTLTLCTTCGASCTYLDMDTANCGTCGVDVTSAGTCTGGIPKCAGALALCGSSCKDLQTDTANCGGCGVTILTGGTCNAGVPECIGGQSNCSGVCKDLQTDPANCGSCDRPQPVGGSCVAGVPTCPNSGMPCDGACKNTQSDPTNCGGCGVNIPTGGSCVAGVPTCREGHAQRAGRCPGWSSRSSSTIKGLSGVWGNSASDVWAVGDGGTILHYDGSAWFSVSSGTIKNLRGVWGSSASDVWAVGDGGTILHYNGAAWSSVSSGLVARDLRGVWGSSASDVWVVGAGLIARYKNAAWSYVERSTLPDPWTVYSVWGSSYEDSYMWVVGNRGSVTRYRGGSAPSYPSNTANDWYGLGGTSELSDVWMVGGNGAISHYNSGLSSVFSGTNNSLYGVYSSSGSDVWAVGSSGTVVHYNGAVWSSVPSGTTNTLRGVWGHYASAVWAVGDSGTLLRFGY